MTRTALSKALRANAETLLAIADVIESEAEAPTQAPQAPPPEKRVKKAREPYRPPSVADAATQAKAERALLRAGLAPPRNGS